MSAVAPARDQRRPGRSLPRPPEREGSGANEHPDVAARRFAAGSSGLIGDEATARQLLSDLADTVRAAALHSLSRLDRLGPAELTVAINDPSALVRRTVAELARPGANYRQLLDDEDPGVIEAACYASGEIGDIEALGQLVEIARTHDDPLCRESAVAALGVLRHPDGKAAILEALQDRPEIRRRAVIALSAFSGEDVQTALTGRLTDRDWQVRQAAEDVLAIATRGRR